MAKKISKMLLNEAKSGMNDFTFFSSQTMITHFEQIIEGVCKTYRKHISIKIEESGPYVAYTDSRSITVSLSSEFILMRKSRIEKYYAIIGIILHECAHILYTDFLLGEKTIAGLKENELLPKIPISKTLQKYFEENLGSKFTFLYHLLDNSIEDGYIERRILKQVPGYGECLLEVRNMHLATIFNQSYAEEVAFYKESGIPENPVFSLLNLVLAYAKFDYDNTGKIEDEVTEVFSSLKDIINKAVRTINCTERKKLVNTIFDRIVEFFGDKIKEELEAGKSLDPSKMMEAEKDALESALEELSDKFGKLAEKTMRSDKDIPKPVKESIKGELGSEGDMPGGSGKPDGASLDISYLEDSAAKEIIANSAKRGIVEKMRKIAKETIEERVDKFPSIESYLEPDEAAIREYNHLHVELDRIAKRIAKNLDKIIKERLKGDRLTGLYMGKQLDCSKAYRKDKRIFSNKILPEKAPDMEVAVLVDCSGSMKNCERMNYAVKCAYITWKFCNLLEIPCSIYGHTTDYSPERHVLIQCVAHPENLDNLDGKRIFMLRPLHNNRDGWAINFTAKYLSKSQAQKKLLLIISDGVPAAKNYTYDSGKRDCREVIKKYKKKGIRIITAGIDSCAEEIKDVYLKDISPKEAAVFLDYSDMEKLPKAFATLIKKELL